MATWYADTNDALPDDSKSTGTNPLTTSTGAGNDQFYGGGGVDKIRGYAGSDYIAGGAGDDMLYGANVLYFLPNGSRNPYTSSDDGDDTFYGGPGNDTIFGFTSDYHSYSDTDVVRYDGSRDQYVFAGTASDFTVTGFGYTDRVVDVERIQFTGSGEFISTLGLFVADDYRNDTATTGSVGVGAKVQGSLEYPLDRDWFKLQLVAGQNYVIEVIGEQTPNGQFNPNLNLRDAQGYSVAWNDDYAGSQNARVNLRVLTSGTYYLDIRSSNQTQTGNYEISLATVGDGRFAPPELAMDDYGYTAAAGGWTSADHYPRRLGDIDADGRMDIVGFGEMSVFVSYSRGFHVYDEPTAVYNDYAASPAGGGWTSNERYPRLVADVDGNGYDDIVGFGERGVLVALSDHLGLQAQRLGLESFGASAAAGGWTSADHYPRLLADVNGDGRADIVGFGEGGVWVSLHVNSGGADFEQAQLKLTNFGASDSAGGWNSNDRYPRELADINGDGYADIVGFGENGVWVALGDGAGGFGMSKLAQTNFGASEAGGGWSSNDRYPRQLADVNGDGMADIVAFGENGVWVALADGTGNFGLSSLVSPHFGASAASGGWTSQSQYPRLAGDVTGDGLADIVAFGHAGVWVSEGQNVAGFFQV